MLFLAGIPMFFMELFVGQFVSLSPVVLFPKMAPVLSGLGFGMLVIALLTSVYFNVIIAWCFFYVSASFGASSSSSLPWGHCDNAFNSHECFTESAAASCGRRSLFYYNGSCLGARDYCGLASFSAYNGTHCYDPSAPAGGARDASGCVRRVSASEDYFRNRMLGVSGRTWEDMGGLRWELVGWLTLSWLIVGACLARGVRTTGKIVYFTAMFPYFILLALFVRGMMLEGSQEGIEFYFLRPNVTRLLDIEVWSDAAIQIFYSLGVCFGCLITLASYNKFDNNCMRDAFVVSFSNCLTSVFIGFVIFSNLGFLAKELGVEVKDVASSGSGLAFVVYPAAISLMPLPQLWSVLFFAMMINVGLGSQFTMVETITTALVDKYDCLRHRKPAVVLATCILIFLMGLPMCLEGGIFVFELFVFYSASVSVIILGIVQLCSVQYVYGFKKVVANLKEMGIYLHGPFYWYFAATWLFITPAILLLMAFFSVYNFVPASWGDYLFPRGIQVLGWFLIGSSMGCVPIGALYALCSNRRGLRGLFEASKEFCPASLRRGPLQEAQQEAQREAQQEAQRSRFRYVHHNDGFLQSEVSIGQEDCHSDNPPSTCDKESSSCKQPTFLN